MREEEKKTPLYRIGILSLDHDTEEHTWPLYSAS